MGKLRYVRLPVSDKEWRAFRLACIKNGTSMVQVFLKAMRDYLKGGKPQ